ncbi:NPCBM/NEW2 domain-containing protein [Paenibacillus cremeus]|uniref:Glycosyl hydrolase family 98 putative carbohydrate-binding module domain-containing protein n=1 Tax=Paenibacillus cremeus TaxID=2163881 RepID=A0A559K8W8_9BACL|nr:NPCBM/NEW2 domain-containing protein [Paenibacillus cremeus]TVY08568.1 hypothetical protein FPZ49_18290 [Paenibacillus cremeus]
MKKKMLLTLLPVCMLFSAGAGAMAASNIQEVKAFINNEIKFTLNGEVWQPKDKDDHPLSALVYDGSSYLPVRAVAEATGLSIDWDAGKIALSSLKPQALTGQWAAKTIAFNELIRDPEPHPLKIQGVVFDSGLAASLQPQQRSKDTESSTMKTITYSLNAQYASLGGSVGMDDRSWKGVNGSIRFTGDGREIRRVSGLKNGNAPVPVALDVRGVTNLTISFEMDNPDPSYGVINLDFVNAYLSK